MAEQQTNSEFALGKVPLYIALIALSGIPFAYIQASVEILQTSPTLVMWFAVVSLSCIGVLAYITVFRHLPKNIRRSPYLIFFAVFGPSLRTVMR